MSSLTLLDRMVADKQADEAAWLAARRQGVTATNVRDLEKSWNNRKEMIAEKRTGIRSFHGNEYTAWGLEREPVIAAEIRRKFGHEPSDVTFHAHGNERYLATPDGLHIKDGLVTIAEIKTSGKSLHPGSEAFIKSHYMAQCQWQMMVAGDDVMECLFAWEVREGQPGSFTPGEMGFAWIERDNGHIAELIALADRFLDELDGKAPEVEDDPADYEYLVAEYLQFTNTANEYMDRAARVLAEIRERIGDRKHFSIETGAGKIVLNTPKPTSRFDSTAFKLAQPDVYAEFTKTSQAKPSLRITPSKEVSNDVL